MDDANMYNLRAKDKESTTQPLLSGMYGEDSQSLATGTGYRSKAGAKSFNSCVECGAKIPPYSNYFCEDHLADFLQGAGKHPDEFSQTKDQFTISSSKKKKTYSV